MTAALIADLLALFRRYDPIDLCAAGAPADEYRPEVEALVADLPLLGDSTEVCPLVHGILQAYFAPRDVGPQDKYRELSQDVWAIWRRHARE